MNVKVCYGCPLRHGDMYERSRRTRCKILQEKLDGVRGLGLKGIDFDCPTKLALFHPGQCVSFLGTTEDGECDKFIGFVWRWDGNKVRVVSEETDKPICRIYPYRLTPINEPDRRVCVHCGMPEGINRMFKTKLDREPRRWVCREEYQEWPEEPKPLPCEYGPAPASNDVEKSEIGRVTP